MTIDAPPPRWRAFTRLGQLVRFGQAAAVNTAFGYGVYALLIRAGMNLFAAQFVAQVVGVAFNYLTYSRHVFRHTQGSKAAFVLAYITNYLFNLILLAIFVRVIPSKYAAGLVATIVAALINYGVLRTLVFRRKLAGL